ncbi:TrmB family transcriptional regulator [Micromonospora sp. CA-263727]|uniref:TrmB family transcriptional regulator n=1 Tax=Micromonospora sp. CA-263727 TaxID=3239967 RepID=UPI003D8E9CCC
MLTGIDMPPGAEAVYLVLLDRRTAALDELSAAVGLALAETSAMLGWLREHRLVLRSNGTGDEWAAADPGQALRALLRAREDELHGLRTALPDLRERYVRSRRGEGTGQVLEHLSTWEVIGNRYHELLQGARREVTLWDHAPYVTGPPAPAEQSVLDRGVRFRILCDPADLPPDYASDRGVQVRVQPELPFRGAVVDRSTALIMLDRESPNERGLLVRASPLLDALALLHEISWSRAVPMAGRHESLTGPELKVMTLMAAGFKDEAMARHLDVTTRTVRRRVQAVLTALNARSRFEAGVEAARRGLV